MSDKIPPLPPGATMVGQDELPPLPKGAKLVTKTGKVEVSDRDMQERMNPFASEETVYDPVSGAPMGFGAPVGAALMSGAAGTLKPIEIGRAHV